MKIVIRNFQAFYIFLIYPHASEVTRDVANLTERKIYTYIVGSRGASQLGGYLQGTPPGYKANKL